MTIIANGVRLAQHSYGSESEFENEIFGASKTLFGPSSVFINAKKKVESRSLGSAVPDGFMFDFADPTDPQFYLVEIELSSHSFYNHIFPQITKFFAFFNNTRLQKSLVDRLFTVVNGDTAVRSELRLYLGHSEVYKFLSDVTESSPNILLVSDGPIPELHEIMETYTDTWGRLVRFVEIKKHVGGDHLVFSIVPDMETLQFAEPLPEGTGAEREDRPQFTEMYHLENASESVGQLYARIKHSAARIDPRLVFNPQKYYISIRDRRNIAFLQLRKKKIRFVAMMTEDKIRSFIKHHPISPLSEGVQKFYNGPCAVVQIASEDHFEEIEALLSELVSGSGVRTLEDIA